MIYSQRFFGRAGNINKLQAEIINLQVGPGPWQGREYNNCGEKSTAYVQVHGWIDKSLRIKPVEVEDFLGKFYRPVSEESLEYTSDIVKR